MREHEIRPKELFDEYIRLCSNDIKKYFSEGCRVSISCPACCQSGSPFSFKKKGFDYVECVNCKTLYLSPRPPLVEFKKFYTESTSARFWAKDFFPAVMEIRREKIFKPNAKKIHSICYEKGIGVKTIIDVGAGCGIFLEEWRKNDPEAELIAIEPLHDLSKICQSKGIQVVTSIVEKVSNLQSKANLVVCFEVIEHAHDPFLFVKAIKEMVAPGGLAVFTGLGVDGFDIQVLWDKSKSIFPPHHINFMSVSGFHRLFQRAGFAGVEVVTPGKLDVDIVLNSREFVAGENRFVETLLNRGEEALGELQSFLAKYQLSSHCWVLASME